MVLNAIEITSR